MLVRPRTVRTILSENQTPTCRRTHDDKISQCTTHDTVQVPSTVHRRVIVLEKSRCWRKSKVLHRALQAFILTGSEESPAKSLGRNLGTLKCLVLQRAGTPGTVEYLGLRIGYGALGILWKSRVLGVPCIAPTSFYCSISWGHSQDFQEFETTTVGSRRC